MRDWDTPLAPEERDALIEKIAQGVIKRKLEAPAILFLEMHKPFGFIASQGLIVTSPLIAPFTGLENLQVAGVILQERANVERLIRRIEYLSGTAPSHEQKGSPT